MLQELVHNNEEQGYEIAGHLTFRRGPRQCGEYASLRRWLA